MLTLNKLTMIRAIQVSTRQKCLQQDCNISEVGVCLNIILNQCATSKTQMGLLILHIHGWHIVLFLWQGVRSKWIGLEAKFEVLKTFNTEVAGHKGLGAKRSGELVSAEFEIAILACW